ncbi:hypothetical protein BUE76_11035 [Cnuella takakiae]|nr:hypothetical protein BUE76_11035 [Cnuella takakiae]
MQSKELISLNDKACWYVDSTGTASMEEVWSMATHRCAAGIKREVENFGFTDKAYFARFSLHEAPDKTVSVLVENTYIDTIELWYQYKGRIVQKRAGAAVNDALGVDPSFNYAFHIPTDGGTQEVLVRYKHQNLLVVPMFLTDARGLEIHNLLRYLTELTVVGIFLTLMVYNMLQVLAYRRMASLLYMGYICSLLLFIYLFMYGYANLLPINFKVWINTHGYELCIVSMITFLGFNSYYLPASLVGTRLTDTLRVLLFLLFFLLLASKVLPEQIIAYSVTMIAIVVPPFQSVYAYYGWRRGEKQLRFFFVGSVITNINYLAYTLALADVIDFTWVSLNYSLGFGFFLELLFLNIHLSGRVKLLNKQKEELSQKMLRLTRSQKKRLEQEVALQTEALRMAITELEQTSEVKTKLLGIISHDLRLPFVTLNGTLELLQMGILPPNKVQQKVQHISSSIRQISITLENLLTWSKSQQQKINTQTEPVALHTVTTGSLGLLQEMIQNKQLYVSLQVPEDTYVEADYFQLEIILRNLLSNAVKASPAQGRIVICYQAASPKACCISITDEGKGIEAESLDALLQTKEPLKSYSISNGLGLQICREFLANHHSCLHYRRENGISIFSFSLPPASYLSKKQCGAMA